MKTQTSEYIYSTLPEVEAFCSVFPNIERMQKKDQLAVPGAQLDSYEIHCAERRYHYAHVLNHISKQISRHISGAGFYSPFFLVCLGRSCLSTLFSGKRYTFLQRSLLKLDQEPSLEPLPRATSIIGSRTISRALSRNRS